MFVKVWILLAITGFSQMEFVPRNVVLNAGSAGIGGFDSRRALSTGELVQLVSLGSTLTDKTRSETDRVSVARKIWLEFPHRVAIPFLTGVIRDENDNNAVRHCAVSALSSIDDESVIPFLINTIQSSQPEIRGRADGQLWKLTGQRPHKVRVDRPNVNANEIEAAVQSWHEWWDKSKANYRFRRTMVLFEY